MSKIIGWEWDDPFAFVWRIDQHITISIPFLSLPEQYFLHLVRFGINHFLWSRAANSRKNLRGIQRGIDKRATCQLLGSGRLTGYDSGVLRAILVDGVSTQKHLFVTKQRPHPICPYCWLHEESLEHLFLGMPALASYSSTAFIFATIGYCTGSTTVHSSHWFALEHSRSIATSCG